MKKLFQESFNRIICIIVLSAFCIAGFQISGVTVNKRNQFSLYDQIIAQKGFIYGVNSPWVEYGNTMGLGGRTVNEVLGKNRERENNQVLDLYRRVLTNCKAVGYDAVKIWLFHDMDGIEVAKNGDIIGLDAYFMDDFTGLMNIAQEIGMPLDLTILPHQEDLYKLFGTDGVYLYNRLTQFAVNPTYRKHFIDRVVKPICEVLNDKYRDTILSITAYCEPEGDTYGEADPVSHNFLYGTSWEALKSCINDIADCVHKELPKVPVLASSGFNPYKVSRYNDMHLDMIGADVYNNSGEVPDPDKMNVNKPMMLSEFGQDCSNGYNHSDDFHISNTMSFYENAKSKGYMGAFYWHFNGYPPLSVTYKHTTYSSLRPIAAVLHYKLIDEANHRKGIESGTVADEPSLLYGDDALTLQWIASRDAKSYTIDVSYNNGKTWSLFGNVSKAEEVTNSANICSYDISTVKQGADVTFRVSVETEEHLKAVSKPITFHTSKITCDDSENLIKNGGFETGSMESWNADKCIQLIKKEKMGDTHRGSYCIALPGDKTHYQWKNISQTVTLKPKSTYRVTFYSKHLWDTYTNNFKLSSYDGEKEVTRYLDKKMAIGNDFTLNTFTFTTDDKTSTVRLFFVNNYEQIFIDSVYLFEVK